MDVGRSGGGGCGSATPTQPHRGAVTGPLGKPCVLAAMLSLWLAGCPGSSSHLPEAKPPKPQPDCPLGGTTRCRSDGKVKLQVVDAAGLVDVLQRHRGKVVLVDFWATWCPPCLELMSHTARLQQRLADRGLVVVAVSLDEPEDEPAVRKQLAGVGASSENYLSRNASGGKFYEVFAISGGALPHLKLYDRRGKLYRTFASQQENVEPEQIDRAVEELLGQ